MTATRSKKGMPVLHCSNLKRGRVLNGCGIIAFVNGEDAASQIIKSRLAPEVLRREEMEDY